MYFILDVPELFPEHAVEIMKQSSCSMQLTNKTDHYVAFKVICCQMSLFNPSYGVVLL
jgi:hypothetical protein